MAAEAQVLTPSGWVPISQAPAQYRPAPSQQGITLGQTQVGTQTITGSVTPTPIPQTAGSGAVAPVQTTYYAGAQAVGTRAEIQSQLVQEAKSGGPTADRAQAQLAAITGPARVQPATTYDFFTASEPGTQLTVGNKVIAEIGPAHQTLVRDAAIFGEFRAQQEKIGRPETVKPFSSAYRTEGQVAAYESEVARVAAVNKFFEKPRTESEVAAAISSGAIVLTMPEIIEFGSKIGAQTPGVSAKGQIQEAALTQRATLGFPTFFGLRVSPETGGVYSPQTGKIAYPLGKPTVALPLIPKAEYEVRRTGVETAQSVGELGAMAIGGRALSPLVSATGKVGAAISNLAIGAYAGVRGATAYSLYQERKAGADIPLYKIVVPGVEAAGIAGLVSGGIAGAAFRNFQASTEKLVPEVGRRNVQIESTGQSGGMERGRVTEELGFFYDKQPYVARAAKASFELGIPSAARAPEQVYLTSRGAGVYYREVGTGTIRLTGTSGTQEVPAQFYSVRSAAEPTFFSPGGASKSMVAVTDQGAYAFTVRGGINYRAAGALKGPTSAYIETIQKLPGGPERFTFPEPNVVKTFAPESSFKSTSFGLSTKTATESFGRIGASSTADIVNFKPMARGIAPQAPFELKAPTFAQEQASATKAGFSDQFKLLESNLLPKPSAPPSEPGTALVIETTASGGQRIAPYNVKNYDAFLHEPGAAPKLSGSIVKAVGATFPEINMGAITGTVKSPFTARPSPVPVLGLPGSEGRSGIFGNERTGTAKASIFAQSPMEGLKTPQGIFQGRGQISGSIVSPAIGQPLGIGQAQPQSQMNLQITSPVTEITGPSAPSVPGFTGTVASLPPSIPTSAFLPQPPGLPGAQTGTRGFTVGKSPAPKYTPTIIGVLSGKTATKGEAGKILKRGTFGIETRYPTKDMGAAAKSMGVGMGVVKTEGKVAKGFKLGGLFGGA